MRATVILLLGLARRGGCRGIDRGRRRSKPHAVITGWAAAGTAIMLFNQIIGGGPDIG